MVAYIRERSICQENGARRRGSELPCCLMGQGGEWGAQGQGAGNGDKREWRQNMPGSERLRGQRDRANCISARSIQAELKRNWPNGGRSGGKRQARNPSQTARAKPCSVALRAQS